MREGYLRVLVLVALSLFAEVPQARAQCPVSPDTANTITRYFHSDLGFVTDLERAAVSRALSFIEKGGTETVGMFERLVADLRGTAPTDVSGVANVRDLVKAIAVAQNEQQAIAYVRALDRFWPARSQGIAMADPFGNGATSNIRRVAGGSVSEMFEMAAAHWLVENGHYTPDQFVAFGRKVLLTSPLDVTPASGFAEADHLIESGRRIVSDAKYTLNQPLDIGGANFDADTVRKWARGLRDSDFAEVIVPTNGTPSNGLANKIAQIFESESATLHLSQVRIVYVAIPGF